MHFACGADYGLTVSQLLAGKVGTMHSLSFILAAAAMGFGLAVADRLPGESSPPATRPVVSSHMMPHSIPVFLTR
ncbi:hypothetical protein AA19596_1421 [Acetobacter fabarum DSM 19596]|jgi:hypothetical protein|nr:hypothetical protein AA19596_1421 [Acetobacter fabarum DSM 19596]